MTKDEAMKLALEALEWINRVNAMDFEYQRKARESLNAIYEALAEQPVIKQDLTPERPAHQALEKMAENAKELGLDYEPAQQQEPVGSVQCINGVTIGYLDVMQPVGTKLYTAPQPAQPRKPLPFNKEDMEGLDVNQRLGFKLGWKSAEAAHNIKENT